MYWLTHYYTLPKGGDGTPPVSSASEEGNQEEEERNDHTTQRILNIMADFLDGEVSTLSPCASMLVYIVWLINCHNKLLIVWILSNWSFRPRTGQPNLLVCLWLIINHFWVHQISVLPNQFSHISAPKSILPYQCSHISAPKSILPYQCSHPPTTYLCKRLVCHVLVVSTFTSVRNWFNLIFVFSHT